MKLVSSIVAISLLAAFAWKSTTIVFADEWFDSYGKLSWTYERARLDNFGHALHTDEHYRAFIAFYREKSESAKSFEKRVARVKNYMKERFGIKEDRLVVVLRSNADRHWTILQPVRRGVEDPSFPEM